MSDLITVQGVVISAMPFDEYDKRIVLLTRERGKISAFAKGARRQNSKLMAACNPFVFGTFILYEGRTSYNLNQVEISYHFAELAKKQPEIYYGYYFLELADYFGHEGIDEKEMMNLLYITAKALMSPNIDARLVRCIYELRTMVIQGLMPQLWECSSCNTSLVKKDEGEALGKIFWSFEQHGIVCEKCAYDVFDAKRISESTLYTMRYIATVSLSKLYTFTVTEEVLREMEYFVHMYTNKNTDRKFKSLDILNMMI